LKWSDDSFHRRLSRTIQKYTPKSQQEWTTISEDQFVYQGNVEIGTYQNRQFQELRILETGNYLWWVETEHIEIDRNLTGTSKSQFINKSKIIYVYNTLVWYNEIINH